jgi:hypothetical protein
MDGPDHLNDQLTVLSEAPLGKVVGDRRHGIYFIRHPEAGGVFVPNGQGTGGCTAAAGTRHTNGWRTTPTPA